MKKIKANNFDNAHAELKAISEDLVKGLKQKIPHADRKHYVVALVKIIDRPGEVKNAVKIDRVCYDKGRFERMTKNYAVHGYSKMIVLHDPSQLEEDDTVIIPQHVQVKTEAEIRKEVEAENEKVIEQRVKEALAEQASQEGKDGEGDGDGPGPDGGQGDAPMTVEGSKALNYFQLKEFATANKIDLGKAKAETEIRPLIENWITDQATKK